MYYLSPLIAFLASSVYGQSKITNPQETGNCVSGRIFFNAERAYMLKSAADKVNPEDHDVVIEYGATNLMFGPPGLQLTLRKSAVANQTAQGCKVYTSRYLLYGKVSFKVKGTAVPGVILSFLTESERKDSINWDLIGGRPTQAQTNLFYKGIKEFNVHNTSALVPSGIDNVHIYSVDWKRDAITWSVDDTVVRTVIRENSTSQRTPPGERWFPSTPSQIKISIWDAGSVPDNGTQAWAGGVIPWGDRFTLSSQFEYIDIQCYNDQMQSVRTWPSDNSPNANISYPPSTSFFPGSKLPIVIKEESSALANSYWSALSFTFSLIGLLGFF